MVEAVQALEPGDDGTRRDDVQVRVASLAELLEGADLPLAIDTYQRGFVWDEDKIAQLADDLRDYERLPDPKPPYYMGSVLLHRDIRNERRFVIDGQQRLTALCVLYHQLKGELPANCALTYSPQSARRIQQAAAYLRANAQGITADVLRRIEFTLVCVPNIDLAFTFFDTQNNRGVTLHATDLLKAYHLRAVDGAGGSRKDELQALCARRWEGVQRGDKVLSHGKEFTAALFTKFLWRARCWRGNQASHGGHDALLHEFEKQSWAPEGDGSTVPLYRSRHNRLGTALVVKDEGASEIQAAPIPLSPHACDLPFAIRQPVHSGLGFFLYTDKYAALLRRLMTEEVVSTEVHRARDVYHGMVEKNSLYLREIFLLALLMYSDQFGDERLWEFSLWLEHALGAVRLDKQQVRQEAAQNFFRSGGMSLLDMIASAYRPEQVTSELASPRYAKPAVYARESIDADGGGVQSVYKRAVLRYYGREGSLSEKVQWLKNKTAQAAR